MGNQWHFDPDTYLAMVRGEIAGYDELQAALAQATRDLRVRRLLDLGTGTGVTAAALAAVHPGVEIVGVDASPTMLSHAREVLPAADLRVGELDDPLPAGPFELVSSAFAVHHLEAPEKADLFRRVDAVLAPGGRFVLLDVVVPAVPLSPTAAPVPLEAGVDKPSSVAEHLAWLHDAGLTARVVLERDDIAIIAADRPSSQPDHPADPTAGRV